MNICEVVLESEYSKMTLTIVVHSFPELSCRFRNAKDYIQEADNSSMLNFLLPLLRCDSFSLYSDAALNIVFVVHFK